MITRQLLFVTYQGENMDEGFSYAIELAKAMTEDIVLLLVRKRDVLAKRFEDLMAGVAFAEAGEHETAREMLSGSAGDTGAEYPGKLTDLVIKAGKAGVQLTAEKSDKDVVSGIRAYLKDHTGIDKVVLSPAVTESEVLTTKELSRLVRSASRPVVTMTRQSVKAMRDASRAKADTPTRLEPSVSY
jgi:hypothetical protein